MICRRLCQKFSPGQTVCYVSSSAIPPRTPLPYPPPHAGRVGRGPGGLAQRNAPPRPAADYASLMPPYRSALRAPCKPRLRRSPVYAVEVSDHIMIAHSFRGDVFGPAQRLHGATFAVSAAFMAEALDANGIVVDIGRAFEVLREVLAPLNYRNLDDIPAFKSVNTTTEFLTRHVFDGLAVAVKNGELGRDGHEIGAIRVTVAESPTARAWYEGALWQR